MDLKIIKNRTEYCRTVNSLYGLAHPALLDELLPAARIDDSEKENIAVLTAANICPPAIYAALCRDFPELAESVVDGTYTLDFPNKCIRKREVGIDLPFEPVRLSLPNQVDVELPPEIKLVPEIKHDMADFVYRLEKLSSVVKSLIVSLSGRPQGFARISCDRAMWIRNEIRQILEDLNHG